jgi:hypothetical protein
MTRTIRFHAFRTGAAAVVLGWAGLIAPASTQAQFTSQHRALLNHSATTPIIGAVLGATGIPFADPDPIDQVNGERALLGRGYVVQTPVLEPSPIDTRREDLPVDGTWALLGRRDSRSTMDE